MSMHRRSFVRALAAMGIGASAGIPTLTSLVPRARATGETTKTIFLYGANGVAAEGGVFTEGNAGFPELFFPDGTGPFSSISNLRAIGAPELAPHLDHIAIVRGAHRHTGLEGSIGGGFPGGAHCGSAALLLTGLMPEEASVGYDAVYGMAPSVDYEISQRIRGGEPLVMRVWEAPSWAWADGLTWSSPRVPVASEDNAWNAYRRMFMTGAPAEVTEQVATGRRSVNDLLRSRFERVLGSDRIGAFNRRKLEAHQALIREVEQTMVCALEDDRLGALEGRDASWFHANDNRYEAAKLMIDVAVLALACNVHDVATLMTDLPGGNTVWTCPWDGFRLPTGSHRLSHHFFDSDGGAGEGTIIPNAHELNALKDRIHLTLFAYALDRLEAAGILDQGLVVFATGEGTNAHGNHNLPFVLGGGACGRLRGGQAVRLTGSYVAHGYGVPGQPHGVMLNTIAALSGATNADGSPFVRHVAGIQPDGIVSEIFAG